MSHFFNPDNIVMQFLQKMSDLVILNLIFLISCIPVITIGSALSAMYYVNLKIIRGEDPYIWRNYWKAFRENFKQSTIVWLICLALFIFLKLDFDIVNAQKTEIFSTLHMFLLIISAFLISIFIYVFPVISHFVCTTKQAFKNAALMSIAHLPFTLLLLILHVGVYFIATMSVNALGMAITVGLICGFSTISLTACIFFNMIFKRYEPEPEPEPIPESRFDSEEDL